MTLTLLIGFSWYVHGFLAGQPVITDEYLVQFNQLGRRELPASENAWPHYRKAFAALVEPTDELEQTFAFKNDGPSQFPGFAALDPDERKALANWVTENELAWAHFQGAAECRYCYRPLPYDPNAATIPPLMNLTMKPSLRQLRYLAKMGIWRARLAAEAGRLDACIDDCLVIARVATHWHNGPSLIDQLVGVACGGLARGELLRLASHYELPVTTLHRIQTTLAGLYPQGPPPMNFAGERLMVLDMVQHTFTQGGFGGGHLVRGQFETYLEHTMLPEGDQPTACTRMVFRVLDVAYCLLHARRHQTVAKIHEVYDEIDARSRLTPYQRHIRDEKNLADSISLYRYGYILILLPAELRVTELGARFRADHEATLAILALQRYRAETGSYPDHLSRLVQAGYLPAIPMDSFSDGPLVYQRAADGFLLYSVGNNFVDDGGTPGPDDKGKSRPWSQHGDRVFWPPMRPR